jgi:uncharacterized integral membrane protein
MRIIQVTIGIVIGAAAVVFAAQNTDMVEVSFLNWSVSTPRAVMIIVVLALGVILGWISSSIGRRRTRGGSR